MATDTILLEIAEILWSNTEYLDILKSEGYRVTHPILYFCGVFPNKAMWGMATIAGNAMVAGGIPTIEAFAHNVAVQTDL